MIGRRFALLVPRFFFPYSVFSTAAVKIENTSTVVDGESLELQLLLFNFLSNVNRAASKWLAEILPTTTARAPLSCERECRHDKLMSHCRTSLDDATPSASAEGRFRISLEAAAALRLTVPASASGNGVAYPDGCEA